MTTGKKRPIIKTIFRIQRWAKRFTHPAGGVRFGHLRRLHPVSDDWGFDRGIPIDRYYIESFLELHAADIRGRTLEFLNSNYSRRFGGECVTRSDVLHHRTGNPAATLIADISSNNDLPDNAFDCIICTQTLPFIYETKNAVSTLHRILRPGGTLLLTVPGISRISPQDMEETGDYWRFSSASVSRLLTESFGADQLSVRVYGNVLAATCFLHGLACQELTRTELDYTDMNYQILVAARAIKANPGGT